MLLVAGLLPLGGCCSLARLFCGPDRSQWISVRFDSPEHTVATLLEALRRDDPEVVYLCLADRYRQDLGLDGQTVKLAWQKVREAAPGLFLVGYAELPAPALRTPLLARFELLVEGHRLDVELACEAYWEVRYRRSDGSAGEFGRPAADWGSYATVANLSDDEHDRSELRLGPLRFDHEGVDAVPVEAIEQALLARRWKVVAIQQREPQ